jgi:phage/plasmid-associated DNA primase
LSFPNKFEGDKEDQDLLKKLTKEEELSGIFNILMIALRNILKNRRIFVNEKTIQQRREKYELVSRPIECFKNDAIAEDSTEFDNTTKEDLYRAYEIFAKGHKLAIESKENFGKILKNKYEFLEGRESSGRRKTFWRGVRLTEKYHQLIESEQQTLAV